MNNIHEAKHICIFLNLFDEVVEDDNENIPDDIVLTYSLMRDKLMTLTKRRVSKTVSVIIFHT